MKEFEEWLQKQHYLAVEEALQLHDQGWKAGKIAIYFREKYDMKISVTTISRWIKEAKRRGYCGNTKQNQ